MNQHELSRRLFLKQSAGTAGAAWARAVLPGLAAIAQAACTARDEQAPFTTLGADEAAAFEAIAARIIPTTDTPGAREAGVIYFFDQTFGTFNAAYLPMLRGGLAELESGIDGGRKFVDLTAEEQDAVLEANESTPFFGLFRIMTFAGFFGLSKYGGNKDGIGYQLLGIDPNAHAYTAPFGYYDAEYVKEHSDA